MKSIERHKLKENEFAHTMARTRDMVSQRQREITTTVVVVVAAIVLVGGYFAWRNSRENRAQTLLASALAVAEAPVVTPPPPAPGSPPPVQQPGTYRSETDRANAALPKLMEAADRYPSTDAGLTARYRAAGILATLGRYGEADQRYQEVVAKAGSNSIYGRAARLGLGNAQLAQGKK